MSKPKTLKYIQSLAKNRNGKCLSTIAVDSKTHIWWQCRNGHKWLAVYNNIQQGYWCPECAGNVKKTIKDAQTLAKIHNGKCLSTKCIGVFNKLRWKCDNNHVWYASYDNIRAGKWCPECAKGKRQSELKNVLENLLGLTSEYNFKGFPWLKDKKRFEIDIWFSELKLAIEYDGEQHFMPVKIFGGKKHFEKTKKRDILKNKLIASHPDEIKYFIRFSYKEPITEKFVIEKLNTMGIILEQS